MSTDEKQRFPLLKAVFDGDLKQLSALLSDHDADEKDTFGKFSAGIFGDCGRKYFCLEMPLLLI